MGTSLAYLGLIAKINLPEQGFPARFLGAYCARQGAGRHIAPFVVEAVDTVGAGDAFNGALAVALAEGREPEEALGWAMAAGALAVTRSGALDSMLRRDEVEALLCSQKSR